VIDKFRADVMSALAAVPSGASVAVGGFGSSGRPDTLLDALCDLDRRDLHLIVNNVGSCPPQDSPPKLWSLLVVCGSGSALSVG